LTLLLVFAALVLHLSVSWQDFSTLAKNGYLYDDSFYAFQIARNVAEGRGVTFDGVTPTNGFQPLYVFLLVPAYKLLSPDRIAPIYFALTLLAMLTAATAVLLFLIARRYVNDGVALFAAMLWAVSPVVVRQTANGLETSLALFMFAWSVYYYLDRIRSNRRPSTGQFLKLGLLLGFSILARVDEVLLALAMALDYLLVLRNRSRSGESGNEIRGFAATAVTLVAVCLPWAIYGLVAVGSPLQESGSATRFLSVAYAPFFDLGPNDMIERGAGASFVWAHMLHALSVLKVSPPIHVFYRVVEKMGGGAPVTGAVLYVINAISLVALAGFAVWVARGGRANGGQRRGEISFLILFSVLLMAAYSTYIFGVFFFMRYFYPVYFVATICAACVLQDCFHALRSRGWVPRAALVTALSLYTVALLYMGMSSGFRSAPVYHFYDIAQWVEKNTAEDETIGVFQGGTIGYFSNRRVVNLDGKVNGVALAALKSGEIRSYIANSEIDVVMDHASVLELFLGPNGGSKIAGIDAERCFSGASVGAPGWIGYRLATGGVRASSDDHGGGGGLK